MKPIRLGCICAVMACLVGCSAHEFDGSRVKNADEYRLTYSAFSGSDSHELMLQAGDELCVAVQSEDGRLSLAIGIEGETPVYCGVDMDDASFVVGVDVDGKYRIDVSAEQAKGSVHVYKKESD